MNGVEPKLIEETTKTVWRLPDGSEHASKEEATKALTWMYLKALLSGDNDDDEDESFKPIHSWHIDKMVNAQWLLEYIIAHADEFFECIRPYTGLKAVEPLWPAQEDESREAPIDPYKYPIKNSHDWKVAMLQDAHTSDFLRVAITNFDKLFNSGYDQGALGDELEMLVSYVIKRLEGK